MDLDELLNDFADRDWDATLAAMKQVKARPSGNVAQMINRPALGGSQPASTKPSSTPTTAPSSSSPTTPFPPSGGSNPSSTNQISPASSQSAPGGTTVPGNQGQPANGTNTPAKTPSKGEATTKQPPPPATPGVSPLELKADRQDYDEQRQIFTAEGNVEMRFRGAVLTADRLQVNLNNRLAVAEGNVGLVRGDQILRGRRFEYNIVQNLGSVQGARGDIYIPTLSTDTATAANAATAGATLSRPASERALSEQPLTGITSEGGFTSGVGIGPNASLIPGSVPQGGMVRRLRFEAETLDFNPDGWVAKKIDITNDPFSPPELVLRADQATLTHLSPLRDEVRATRPRLVFDQRFTVPLLVSRTVLDRRERQPPLLQFGFDERDRGGFFIERTFQTLNSPTFSLSLTPQFFVQRAFFNGSKTGVSATDESTGVFDPNNFGLRAKLDGLLSPSTQLTGNANLTTLDPSEFEDQARASLRLRQLIGTHTLSLEASYRDRLYNGSLGFQTVQSSFGALFTSPKNVALGNTGINLRYQVGFQNITADTDRRDLLAAIRDNDRTNLSRFQAVAALNKTFIVWRGSYLPATPTEGLRYSPVQLVPYIAISTGLTGVFSAYSNSETQSELGGNITLSGQFGHFSRNFLDYTAFNLGYTQRFVKGESPFYFDRVVDREVITAGITQQIYGPFRAGVQVSFSLTEDNSFSTDYFLEYVRRTYSIVARYNPIVQIGSISFRINDFNWTGGTEPFAGSDITPVEGGVLQRGF
jgi:lipopolysaccharide export system protein LptA